MLGEVAVPVEVGEHPQDGHQLATLGGGGPAVDEALGSKVADAQDVGIDELVVLNELLGGLPVSGQEGVGGPGNSLSDEGEHLDEEAVYLVESVWRGVTRRYRVVSERGVGGRLGPGRGPVGGVGGGVGGGDGAGAGGATTEHSHFPNLVTGPRYCEGDGDGEQ